MDIIVDNSDINYVTFTHKEEEKLADMILSFVTSNVVKGNIDELCESIMREKIKFGRYIKQDELNQIYQFIDSFPRIVNSLTNTFDSMFDITTTEKNKSMWKELESICTDVDEKKMCIKHNISDIWADAWDKYYPFLKKWDRYSNKPVKDISIVTSNYDEYLCSKYYEWVCTHKETREQIISDLKINFSTLTPLEINLAANDMISETPEEMFLGGIPVNYNIWYNYVFGVEK